jgi:hypothetical protein
MEGVTTVRPSACPFGGPAAGMYRFMQDESVSAQVRIQTLVLTGSPAAVKPVRTWDASHAHKGNAPWPLVSQGGSTG